MTEFLRATFQNSAFDKPLDEAKLAKISDFVMPHLVTRAHKMIFTQDPLNPLNRVLMVQYGGNTGTEHPDGYNPPIAPAVYVYVPISLNFDLYFSVWNYFKADFKIAQTLNPDNKLVGWYRYGGDIEAYSQVYRDTYGDSHPMKMVYTVAPNFDVMAAGTILDLETRRRSYLYNQKIGTMPLNKWFNTRYHLHVDNDGFGFKEIWFNKPELSSAPDFTFNGRIIPEVLPPDSRWGVYVSNHYSHVNNDIYGEQPQYTDNAQIWIGSDTPFTDLLRMEVTPPEPIPAAVCYLRELLAGTTAECNLLPMIRKFRDRRLSARMIKDYYTISKYLAPKIRKLRGVIKKIG